MLSKETIDNEKKKMKKKSYGQKHFCFTIAIIFIYFYV